MGVVIVGGLYLDIAWIVRSKLLVLLLVLLAVLKIGELNNN